MTIIIYSIAKGTYVETRTKKKKEIIIMIFITDNQVTSFFNRKLR